MHLISRAMRSARTGLWFVPVACVLAGVLLSFGTTALDRAFDYDLVPATLTGGPDAALAILSTVAASMVSLAALVLTITMVVVQLAMGQFSPRIVQTILQDKPSQLAIGIFVATFAHAMLTMREVSFDGEGQVPGVAVTVAFGMVLVSIAVLVLYVHHIGRSLRVASLIELVSSNTRKLLDELYPDAIEGRPAPDPRVVVAPHSGVVSQIEHEELVELARRAGCVLHLVPSVGTFVPAGAPLFRVVGERGALEDDDVCDQVLLSLERTLVQDAAYGFRQLVDIAERSLSDSPLQDPTTAVQAIDRLHDCLRQVATRKLDDGVRTDANGDVRLVLPTMSWDDYVNLAFDEIRIAGAGSTPVARRLRAALLDLRTVAPPDRVAILDDQLSRLTALTTEALSDERDIEFAMDADLQGIGGGAGARTA